MPAIAILVLAGLFGMHGLTDHNMGPDTASRMAVALSAATADGRTMPHHSAAANHSAEGLRIDEAGATPAHRAWTAASSVMHHAVAPAVLAAGASAPETAHGPSHHGVRDNMTAGLCLAILAGLLLALAAWLSMNRRRAYFMHAARPIPVARPRARDPGPPSLLALSVCRC